MMKKYVLHPLTLVFFAALVIRVVYNLTTGHGYVAQFDAAEYDRLGQHLIKYHCFCNVPHVPSISRAPLWPMFIGIVYWLFGTNNLTARLFLSVLGSGTCVLVYCFARDLFGKRYGLAAGLVAAIYPGLFVYDGWIYSESIYTFLYLAFAYSLYCFQKTTERRWLLLSALSLGMSTLARQNGMFTIALLVVFALVVGWKHIMSWRQAILSTLLMIVLACLVVLPWTIRNYMVSGYIVPVATGSSIVLAGAYNDTVFTSPFLGATGTWVPPDQAQPPIPETQPCCNLSGEDPNQQSYAIHWMVTRWHSMPRLLAMHFINIWRPILPDGAPPVSQFPERFSSKIIKVGLRVMPPVLYVFTTIGLVALWRRRWRDLLTLSLAIGLTVAQCVALYGSVRFRAPIEPMLVILAIGGLAWVVQQVVSWRARRRSTLQTQPQ